MAKKRPRDPVQFTRESAERVANVVRSAELTPPAAAPLSFDRISEGRSPKQVRAARFSGSWPIGTVKTVTFAHAPTSTVNVTNLSWPITETAYLNENCVVGKEGTNWWLVVPVLERRTAVFVTQTQSGTSLVSIAIGATLNTGNCSITVAQTPTTTRITLISATATNSYLGIRVP